MTTRAPRLPAAVLWDMDGTLIDTEPYWIEEEQRLVAEAGGVWTAQDALDLVGQDLMRSATMLLERTPLTGEPEEIVQQLLRAVSSRARAHLPWRPGAQDLLADLVAHGVPCALVTMSWTELSDVLVEALPPGTFATVVTGDQVSRGKPHPEPYLEAARRLGVDPADCVAVEDSPTGTTSATAAGVRTLAVPHIVEIPEMPLAVQVSSLEGLGAADLLGLVADGG